MRPLRLVMLALVALAAWGLWPLGDPDLAIHFDPAEEEAARAFLDRPAPPAAQRPPSIVLILADDLGKHDVSAYAPASLPTPALARLAAEGAVFDAGYVVSPVCAPSRAALLTGRYPQRFGFELLTHDTYPSNRLLGWTARTFFSSHGWHALDEPRVPQARDIALQGLPPGELTLADLLRRHGYATGIFGKWHLGVGERMLPLRRGFDTHYGFYEAFSLFADPDDPEIVGVRDEYFADRYQWYMGRRGNSAIRHDGVVIDEPGYLTTRIAEEASAWIEAQPPERPFFAYVPFNAPHAPIQAPRATVERFPSEPDPGRRVYLAMIAELDDAVGAILATLERTGRADDTIVLFSSDNGAATYTGLATNAPLRGGKFMNFEGGVSVPFLLRWPGRVPPGVRYDEAVSTLDAFATLAAAAGAELPADRVYDGVDLIPYVRGERGGAPHEALYWRTGNHRAIRTPRYKLIADTRTGARVLYEIAGDRFEERDLSQQQPALVEELETRLRGWEATLVEPRWPNVMEYRFREAGHDFVFPL